MHRNIEGMVIKEAAHGEADRIITILSKELGVIYAVARSSRSSKSRLVASTSLLSYGRYTLFLRGDMFIVDDAEMLSSFKHIREDIKKLSLSLYFCELCTLYAPRRENGDDYLRLLLNSLHFLDNGERPDELIKGIFEFRLMSLFGNAPNLTPCGCDPNNDRIGLDLNQGKLVCERCAKGKVEWLNRDVLKGIQMSCFGSLKEAFSFEFKASEVLVIFGRIAEAYLIYQTGQTYKTLDFLKSL